MLSYIPVFAEIWTIVAITAYRLWTLLCPFCMHVVRPRHMRAVVLVLWLQASTYIVVKMIRGQHTYFDPRLLSCSSNGELAISISKHKEIFYKILKNSHNVFDSFS